MRRDEGGCERERELIAGERETRSRWATRRARRLGSRRSVNRRERRMRRPRRARDRRRTAGRVPAQRRAERGGGGVRGEAVNGEHRAMRVSGSTATARGQSGPVSRRRHSHASPLLRLAPSELDKMKRKALPEATRNRIADWHSYEFSDKECAHEVRAKNALRFLFLAKNADSPAARAGIRGTRKGAATRADGDRRGWSSRGTTTTGTPPARPRPPPARFYVSKSKNIQEPFRRSRELNSRRASAAHHLRGAFRRLERNRLVFGDRRR